MPAIQPLDWVTVSKDCCCKISECEDVTETVLMQQWMRGQRRTEDMTFGVEIPDFAPKQCKTGHIKTMAYDNRVPRLNSTRRWLRCSVITGKTWWHKGGRWLKQSGGDPSYGILLRTVESFDVSGVAQTNPDPAGVEAEDNDPPGQDCNNTNTEMHFN